MIKNTLNALTNEILKIRRSLIFWITLLAACFIASVLALMMVLIQHPNAVPPGILKTKISLAAVSADWPAYLGFIAMASAAVGIIIFGFAVSWTFGREYSDRTIKDLLALPVSRSVIVTAKFIAAALWCFLINLIVYLLGTFWGFIVHLPLWSQALFINFTGIFFMTTLLNLMLSPAVAFIASIGKSFLPAIGFFILCMGLANLFGNIGIGMYFPWTIPMLFTGAIGTIGGHLPLASWLIMIITWLAGIAGTILCWIYADQDK